MVFSVCAIIKYHRDLGERKMTPLTCTYATTVNRIGKTAK